VNAVITRATEAMRELSEDMAARRITLGAWQERFAMELKNLHVASAMAGAGGLAQMTPADYGRVGQRLRFEYERLENFAQQLKGGNYTHGQLRNRVEMYCAAGNVSFEAARRDGAQRGGFTEERNRLGRNENHCQTKHGIEGCLDLAALSWVPIGTLPAPGHRVCKSRCMCSLQFRKPKRRKGNDGSQSA
jgi:hypothetical protein